MPSLRAFSGFSRLCLSERRPWAVKKAVSIKENRAFRRTLNQLKMTEPEQSGSEDTDVRECRGAE